MRGIKLLTCSTLTHFILMKEANNMANIYLKSPTIEDKEKWIEYLKEYRLDNPKAKPLSCTENLNYEEWLKKIIKEHNGIDLQEGRVPSSV